MTGLIFGLILAIVVLVACASILWDGYQLARTREACARGDHQWCTPLTPWCPNRRLP